MPMTEPAYAAFKQQMQDAVGSDYLVSRSHRLRQETLPLQRQEDVAHYPAPYCRAYFSLYQLRNTFATRLSAGGVADHLVTLKLRQSNAGVFKRYSHAKLNMMTEELL